MKYIVEKLCPMIGLMIRSNDFHSPRSFEYSSPILNLQVGQARQWGYYALVICNHGPPTPGAGRGIAVEMSGVFTFALSPQCGGNTRDLCYIGKKGGAMKT